MKKTERIRRVIQGQAADRVPFALWRHLPPEDTTPEGLVAATLRFIRRWDMDFVKAMFPNRCFTEDWGNRFGPYNRAVGNVTIVEHAVRQPSDWQTLRPLHPLKGALGEQVRTVTMLRDALGSDIPLVATVFSPLTIARYLAGDGVYDQALTHGGRLHAGLRAVGETVGDFAQACVEAGADGIFLAVQGATRDALPPDAFEEFGLSYDLPVLRRIAGKSWFNILHLCKPNLRFEVAASYPVQAVNWHDRSPSGPTLRQAREMFDGVLIGGLGHDAGEAFLEGTPEEAAAEARDAIAQTGGKRFILGPGCGMRLATPEANVDAVREVAAGDSLTGARGKDGLRAVYG